MSFISTELVISVEIAELLHAYISPIEGGKRKVAAVALDLEGEPVHSTLQNQSPHLQQIIPDEDFITDDVRETVELPAFLESIETLEFIGFDLPTALMLWNWYTNNPVPEFNQSFIETVRSYIEMNSRRVDLCQDEHAALITLGINEKLRTALLDPEFEDVCGTASLSFWVLDSVDFGYGTLVGMDERLRRQIPRLLPAPDDPEEA